VTDNLKMVQYSGTNKGRSNMKRLFRTIVAGAALIAGSTLAE